MITVVTVCYNAVNTIEDTILSVINQTYNNIEYIIVDGASSDGTLDIIKKYENHIAKWISEPDNGIYDAMNKALNLINGDWVFFINSGDYLYRETTLFDIAPKLKDKSVIYYGNVLMLPGNFIYYGKFSKTKLCRHNICHQSIFYPHSVFNKYQYDIKYKVFADHALNLSCMADKYFKFEFVDIIVSFYTLDGVSSKSPQSDVCFRKDYTHIIRKNFGLPFFLYSMSLLYIEIIINKIRCQLFNSNK